MSVLAREAHARILISPEGRSQGHPCNQECQHNTLLSPAVVLPAIACFRPLDQCEPEPESACRNRSGYSRLEHGFTHTARIRYWSKDCEDCSKEHSHSVSPYGPSDEIPGRPVHVTEIEQGAGSPVYTFSVDENCCDKLRVRRPFRQRRSQRQSDTGCLATATAQDLPAVARHRVSWKEKRCMKNEHMSLGAAFVGQTHPESFNMTII
jgi:hypothetical protein